MNLVDLEERAADSGDLLVEQSVQVREHGREALERLLIFGQFVHVLQGQLGVCRRGRYAGRRTQLVS